jgi:titin
VPLTNIVTTTADSGAGSLRAAMYFVEDHPGAMVKFNIATNDAGFSKGVFNIHLTGHLPPLTTDGLVIDGSTQPGFTGKPLIVVDGSQIIPETFTSNSGLLIYSANNQVKNISFTGFNWNGLTLEYADATNNTIAGCWLGLDATGSNAAPNAYQGIYLIQGASRNFIGGTNALARNVISGNAQYGVYISDSNTVGNVVLGNYISTDAGGSNAVPNGKSGVILGGGTSGNLIGSTNAAGRNILSGNPEYGIYLSNTSSNVIAGNYIGVNAGGAAPLGNTLGGIDLFSGAQNNLIGGPGAGARNLISGNTQYGVILIGASSNAIQGNYIGPDSSGQTAPANDNSYGGIGLWGGAANNLFGGSSPGAGNVISGNNSYGIFLEDPGTSGNIIQGNIIGADVTGTNALGNSYAGIALWGGATNNSIGGIGAGAGNMIAFNGYAGVNIYDAPTTNNSIRGNSIFSNSGLGIDLVGAGDVYPFYTPNDMGDADIGPNNLQNFPVLTNAFGYGTSTIVLGKLNSATNASFVIDIYRNLVADFTGYGEGQFYVGTINVTTDVSGNASFALTNNSGNYAGQFFSATATAATGDTSEFSADVLATNAPAPFAQFGAPFVWRTNGFIFNLTFATNFSYHIQATTNLAAPPIPWVNLTNFTAASSALTFTDRTATNFRTRFYRVVSP